MLMVGGALALAVRWQLAFPWGSMPIVGKLFGLFQTEGGQISPEFYTMLFTMHASVMIFLVIIPVLAGAFGNFLIPLQIGADDMAFPILNMLELLVYVAGDLLFCRKFCGKRCDGWSWEWLDRLSIVERSC
jgi:cytochrome c oxidase subunit 1